MRFTLLGVCFICGANVMAQEDTTMGIEVGMELTSELQATHRGDYNYANLLRLNASLPISRGLTIEAASISACMTAPESIGGDLQTFSNIDAGNIAFALSVCNIAWQINDRHALYAGIRNMNEDYFTSPVTSLFTNSSCGIYPTIGANYPIANYPVASVGVHYKYSLSPALSRSEGDATELVVQASLYNGTGYNRLTGHESIFRVCPKDDGVFGIAEVAYTRRGSYYSLGSACYWKDGMSATPWIYAEQSICKDFTLIAGYSHSFTDEAACSDFIGVGAHYQLGKCQLGVFTDYAAFDEADEFATEFTCRLPISEHMHVQPAVHFISTGSKLTCAGMLRMTLSI